MDAVNKLRAYGLFDAKVPRYTSYPPANRFVSGDGKEWQRRALERLPAAAPVSVYVHIPFCRRLCWFCACRTQGTKTLLPVESYVTDLITECEAVAAALPDNLTMARLHLGGGTPTLLPPALLDRLLRALFGAFSPTPDFEFSVEIDPTEAAPDVLDCLIDWSMGRASIGVQDFNPKVQAAIGREQSYDQTRAVVDRLRHGGVESLNVDLLYGLPYQTGAGLMETLDRVVSLRPDRIALYGYAHVPHMSKRQIMIPQDALPSPERRYEASQIAGERLAAMGYVPLGIDHFARPSDSLTRAARTGSMRRNFQGYTDDPCPTLIGLGASAISSFKDGYIQNAVATAAYSRRVDTTGLSGDKGYRLTDRDRLVADAIDQLMCYAELFPTELAARHPALREDVPQLIQTLTSAFPGAFEHTRSALTLRPDLRVLSRVIAARIDDALQADQIHSIAI